MHSRYNTRKKRALEERGRRMANARWKADRARRDEEEAERLQEIAYHNVINLPRNEGDVIGCLQWTDYRSGRVRRWRLRIGDRADRMTVDLVDGNKTGSHGWTWILKKLRKHLSRN